MLWVDDHQVGGCPSERPQPHTWRFLRRRREPVLRNRRRRVTTSVNEHPFFECLNLRRHRRQVPCEATAL
jgi:hypothetical protein